MSTFVDECDRFLNKGYACKHKRETNYLSHHRLEAMTLQPFTCDHWDPEDFGDPHNSVAATKIKKSS